jgi:hypothetical protein
LTTEKNYFKKENQELKSKIEINDVELKRVSETNILIRDILIEKDSLIEKQEKDIKTLKRNGGSLEEEIIIDDELEEKIEEEKPKEKTDLLNQILEKERRDRVKRKKEEENKNE